MTPTDFVAILAIGMLIFGWACLGVLVAWMLWDLAVAPIWRVLLYHWRAWRGRDPDDKWHA